jgi:hypothetical protein
MSASAAVVFKAPKFKPLPGELTPAVMGDALLPVKIEAMSRAITACQSLPELLAYKKPIDGLAAAAKTIKEIPEYARRMKRVQKEAIFRMGELLSLYTSTFDARCNTRRTLSTAQTAEVRKDLKDGMRQVDVAKKYGVRDTLIHKIKTNPNFGTAAMGPGKSERATIAESLGISSSTAVNAVRLAAAPAPVKESILADPKIPANAARMVSAAPRRGPLRREPMSDAASILFSGILSTDRKYGNGKGLIDSARILKGVDVTVACKLTPEEKQRARKLVVEMQEILDEIDRRLGPAVTEQTT